jgi:hypothetical protein
MSLAVPQLEVLIYVAAKDQRFEETLGRAIEKHRTYWGGSRQRDFHGFIATRLTGLAALGRDAGLISNVESPYTPMHLVKL